MKNEEEYQPKPPQCPNCKSIDLMVTKSETGNYLYLICRTCTTDWKLIPRSEVSDEIKKCPYCPQEFITSPPPRIPPSNPHYYDMQKMATLESISYEMHVLNHKMTTLNKIQGRGQDK